MPDLSTANVSSAPDAVTPEPAESQSINSNLMSEIDGLFGAPAAPAEKPNDAEKTEQPPKEPAPEKKDKPADRPDEKAKVEDKTKVTPDKTAKPADKPTEVPPASSKELRRQVETLLRENAELKQAQNKAPKPDPNAPDPKILGEQLTASQKELQRLQDEIRFINYEQSQEYVQKYKEPMDKAFKSAFADLSELKVSENGEQRPAVEADFLQLIKLPMGDAISRAKELFGDAATEVLAHRRKVIELNNARTEAIKEYREKGAQRETLSAQQRQQQARQFEDTFKQVSEATIKKYPQFFGPDEGDETGNAELKKGFDYVDRIYSDKTLTPDQQILMRTQVRLRAAAYPRELHRSATLRAKVAELEKELEEYRQSDPGTKAAGGDAKQKTEMSWEQEIEALARSAK